MLPEPPFSMFRSIVLSLAAVCLLGGMARAREESPRAFTLVRVKYGGGGDWYSDPTSLPNLLAACRERLGIDAARKETTLAIGDIDLFKHPFLCLTGHGNVKFTDAEIERLRKYLAAGGFLWCDDNGPIGTVSICISGAK
jgi:hypothetical protein